MADSPGLFAGVLRELRRRARLTQEELADAAGVSLRALSDLERGAATSPQKETVRLLADGLGLIGPERVQFETAARGRPLKPESQAAAAAAMRTLPRDVASFIGRQRELDQLMDSAVTGGGVVAIRAIGGMTGVGKTAFAVHAAHQLADRFPGGQIFLLLHGHTPGQSPVDPADALASLLLTAGVPAALIPRDLEARAALWRDRVREQPLLLILDDAASSDQVLPLLPGAGGSLVLVTSRRHLSALDDATMISLDSLPPGEAGALLVRLAGRGGLSPEHQAVAQITRLCGYLPLAIGMMGRQLRHHPAWTVAGRAAELASARDRLELMETENLSVAAAFDLSYADLAGDQQRLFRRLGLHRGTDIDAYAAAALNDISLSGARRGLEALYDQYLLAEPVHGRYRPHDLIREHARALADRLDPEEEREAAIVRLLDYYQHTAGIANALIARLNRPGRSLDSGIPAAVPALADREQALTWARAERTSLLACIDYAVATGQHARVIAFTAGISAFMFHDGLWADAAVRHQTAIQAALQIGDQLSHANALIDLALIQHSTGVYATAVQAREQALNIYRDLGDRLGEAHALSDLANGRFMTGDYRFAAQALEEALGIYRDLSDQPGQALALSTLGHVQSLMGAYQPAAQAEEEALRIYRDLGNRLGQATSLIYLGIVLRHAGDYQRAARAHEEALGIYRDLGAPLGEANALYCLGTVLQVTDEYPAAVRAQEEALAIYRDIGHRAGEANALVHLGTMGRLKGDYQAAARAVDAAIDIHVEMGNRGGLADTLNERGALHRVCGELALARKCHQRSLQLSRESAGSSNEAHALAGLGRCALANGDTVQARRLLEESLEIFQRLGTAEAAELRTEIAALTGPTT